MFTTEWLGNDDICDCTNNCGYYMEQYRCYTLNVGRRCDYNETRYGCDSFRRAPPMPMHKHGLKTICGKRSGVPFANIVRADHDNKCPVDHIPCSEKTTAENTICYPKSETNYECPITDIRFVLTTEKATVLQSNDYKSMPFNQTTELLYSKSVGDNLPITTH